jgi:hypothetical protein
MVKTNKESNNTKIRRFQLCVDKLETLEDVKKVLNAMKIRIDTDNLDYESVKDYFCLEIVPKGYFKLLEKIGHEGIAELHYHEIEQQALELLNENEK